MTTRTRTIRKGCLFESSIALVIVLVPRPLAVTRENRWRNEYEHENEDDGGEGHLFKSSIVLVLDP
jgi:hypothetical protein